MTPPKMPWWMRACCRLRYGADAPMAVEIYQRLLDEAYLDWEAEDWRKDLDARRRKREFEGVIRLLGARGA